MGILASYPIHYHMARDTDKNGDRPYVRGNAIHDTFSRCVTIHGTNGVLVEHNAAVDHHGHCFFFEDGGEQRNILNGNLGMGTRYVKWLRSYEVIFLSLPGRAL